MHHFCTNECMAVQSVIWCVGDSVGVIVANVGCAVVGVTVGIVGSMLGLGVGDTLGVAVPL